MRNFLGERVLDYLLEGFQLISFDWTYLYVNNTVVEQSKFSKTELVGFTMMEKYPGIENSELFKTLKDCMDNRVARQTENEFIYADGSKAWFRLNIQPVPEGIFIMSLDIYNISHLEEKLGMPFLQMHNNFAPKDFERIEAFVKHWPDDFPLAIEFRHTDWYNDKTVSEKLYTLLEKRNISNVIVDTAERRDLMHMRLTTPIAFIRYVGANHKTDHARLDDWINRIKGWKKQGLEKLYFFVIKILRRNLHFYQPILLKS